MKTDDFEKLIRANAPFKKVIVTKELLEKFICHELVSLRILSLVFLCVIIVFIVSCIIICLPVVGILCFICSIFIVKKRICSIENFKKSISNGEYTIYTSECIKKHFHDDSDSSSTYTLFFSGGERGCFGEHSMRADAEVGDAYYIISTPCEKIVFYPVKYIELSSELNDKIKELK